MPSPLARCLFHAVLLCVSLSGSRDGEKRHARAEKPEIGCKIFGIEVAEHWCSSWYRLGVGICAAELLGGVVWWCHSCGNLSSEYCFEFIMHWVHALTQFLPFATLWPSWKERLVDCQTGLLWPVHWTYLLCLMSCLPELGRVDQRSHKYWKVQIIGCQGSSVSGAYMFFDTAANASDGYLDSMAAVIAIRCGWHLASWMVGVLVGSLLLQALAAAYFTGLAGVGKVICGTSPEAGCADAESYAADDGDEENMNDERIHQVKVRVKNANQFLMSQGLAKFCTENCPQSYLQVRFALEVKPNKLIWLSVAMSLFLSGKAFANAISMWIQMQKDNEETPIE